jgi:hypothetical protein
MAVICPFADWRPLPEATSQPKIDPRTLVFHTAVGTLRGVENYFRTGTTIESHVMVGGPWDGAALDGAIWQWMDLGRQADANRQANSFAISAETSDNAPQSADDLAPWSPKQLASLVRFGNWCADRFNIPRRQCPTPTSGGFGWHAMWSGTGFMLSDGTSPWTPSRGKVCPGSRRIHQLKTIVFPAIFAGRELEEDDMSAEAEAQIKRIHDGLVVPGTADVSQAFELLFNRVKSIERALIVPGTTTAEEAFNLLFARVRGIEAAVEEIRQAVIVAEPPPPPAP